MWLHPCTELPHRILFFLSRCPLLFGFGLLSVLTTSTKKRSFCDINSQTDSNKVNPTGESTVIGFECRALKDVWKKKSSVRKEQSPPDAFEYRPYVSVAHLRVNRLADKPSPERSLSASGKLLERLRYTVKVHDSFHAGGPQSAHRVKFSSPVYASQMKHLHTHLVRSTLVSLLSLQVNTKQQNWQCTDI